MICEDLFYYLLAAPGGLGGLGGACLGTAQPAINILQTAAIKITFDNFFFMAVLF